MFQVLFRAIKKKRGANVISPILNVYEYYLSNRMVLLLALFIPLFLIPLSSPYFCHLFLHLFLLVRVRFSSQTNEIQMTIALTWFSFWAQWTMYCTCEWSANISLFSCFAYFVFVNRQLINIAYLKCSKSEKKTNFCSNRYS